MTRKYSSMLGPYSADEWAEIARQIGEATCMEDYRKVYRIEDGKVVEVTPRAAMLRALTAMSEAGKRLGEKWAERGVELYNQVKEQESQDVLNSTMEAIASDHPMPAFVVPTMTVAELIEKLKTFPPTMRMMTTDREGDYYELIEDRIRVVDNIDHNGSGVVIG